MKSSKELAEIKNTDILPLNSNDDWKKILGIDYNTSVPDIKIDPMISWNHVDGPLLICSDGSIHWLTFFERLQLFFKIIDIQYLDNKYAKYYKLRKN